MIDVRLRVLVQRILRGVISACYFQDLFLALRFQAHVSQAVEEIGHFLAHPDLKNRGPVTERVKDFFTIMRYMCPEYERKMPPPDLRNIPNEFLDFVEANHRALSDEFFHQHNFPSRAKAERMLRTIRRKYRPNVVGLSLREPLYGNEVALLMRLHSYFGIRGAFTGDEIYEDFVGALEREGLLLHSEIDDFEQVGAYVILFAVSAMHGRHLRLDDGTDTKLRAGGDCITLWAEFASPQFPKEPTICAPMVATNLPVRNHCDESLIRSRAWAFPIELGPDGKLRAML